MNTKVFAITAVIVTGLMFGLCANAHIDFFPCDVTARDTSSGYAYGEGPIRTSEGTCSFMAHLRPEMRGEKERLTGAGWALLVVFNLGIGLAAGGLASKLTGKREA